VPTFKLLQSGVNFEALEKTTDVAICLNYGQ
jgi:hypothetical protein